MYSTFDSMIVLARHQTCFPANFGGLCRKRSSSEQCIMRQQSIGAPVQAKHTCDARVCYQSAGRSTVQGGLQKTWTTKPKTLHGNCSYKLMSLKAVWRPTCLRSHASPNFRDRHSGRCSHCRVRWANDQTYLTVSCVRKSSLSRVLTSDLPSR